MKCLKEDILPCLKDICLKEMSKWLLKNVSILDLILCLDFRLVLSESALKYF